MGHVITNSNLAKITMLKLVIVEEKPPEMKKAKTSKVVGGASSTERCSRGRRFEV